MDIPSFTENLENAINNVEPGTLAAETRFKELPQWDSMAFLCVLAMIDGDYGVELPEAELRACTTVQELYDAVSAKL
ncbi:MAG: acyl carrier protein [Verrucomicrobiota bacterium JB024]|jgi:acyl carrier protein|nr:acyl carrier protein [Verrucomicrobiota bacterium JB024]